MSLFFILQIVLRRRFRQYEGVQHKPRSQPEAGDEAVQGGVTVVGGPGVGEVPPPQRQRGGFVEVVSLLDTEKKSFMRTIFLFSYKIDLITCFFLCLVPIVLR